MSVSQQLLHYQLSLAHGVCQQLPADSRVRHRITQLLEVAMDLATCADTPLGPWQWGPTSAPPACSAWPAQSFPAAANPWHQHTATTAATTAAASRRYRQCKRRERLYGKRACHNVKDSQQQGTQQQDGQEQSNQQQDSQQQATQQQNSSQQQGPADPPTPSTSHPAEPQASLAGSSSPSTSPHTAPRALTVPAVGFSVHAAWVHGIAGLSQQEVSALVAAVRSLSSAYGPVQTAAAVKLQGITAHSTQPTAVAEALVELDAVQVGYYIDTSATYRRSCFELTCTFKQHSPTPHCCLGQWMCLAEVPNSKVERSTTRRSLSIFAVLQPRSCFWGVVHADTCAAGRYSAHWMNRLANDWGAPFSCVHLELIHVFICVACEPGVAACRQQCLQATVWLVPSCVCASVLPQDLTALLTSGSGACKVPSNSCRALRACMLNTLCAMCCAGPDGAAHQWQQRLQGCSSRHAVQHRLVRHPTQQHAGSWNSSNAVSTAVG
jgi:hypothetical protein